MENNFTFSQKTAPRLESEEQCSFKHDTFFRHIFKLWTQHRPHFYFPGNPFYTIMLISTPRALKQSCSSSSGFVEVKQIPIKAPRRTELTPFQFHTRGSKLRQKSSDVIWWYFWTSFGGERKHGQTDLGEAALRSPRGDLSDATMFKGKEKPVG